MLISPSPTYDNQNVSRLCQMSLWGQTSLQWRTNGLACGWFQPLLCPSPPIPSHLTSLGQLPFFCELFLPFPAVLLVYPSGITANGWRCSDCCNKHLLSWFISHQAHVRMLISLAWMLTGWRENVQYIFSLCLNNTSDCLAWEKPVCLRGDNLSKQTHGPTAGTA